MKTLRHLLALGFLLGVLPSAALALTVSSSGDSGPNTLRQAVTDVAPGGTIDFATGLGNQTITLLSELVVSKAVIIDASSLVVSGAPASLTINGGNATRLFSVTGTGNLTLRSLNLTGGNGVSTDPANNLRGGAIYNVGTLTVERCAVYGNSSGPGASGGGIWSTTNATISQCTIYNNASGRWGGGLVTGGTVAVTHCTIVGNSAVNNGGGIMISSGTVTVTNSILSGNTSPLGPDIWSNGLGANLLRVGANIIRQTAKDPASGDSGPAAITADPLLGPLAFNGGRTQTMALLAYSQAIDGVPASAAVAVLDSDQRGFARSVGAGPDIGAYESGDATFTASGLTLFARVAAAQAAGSFFEISTFTDFHVPLPVAVSTLAGTANTTGAGDGTRLSATFDLPSGLAQDSQDNIFIADAANNVIRMLAPDGTVSTIAGSGAYGRAEGPGLSAAFALPSAVAVGPDDNLYVSDTYNHRICKVTRPAAAGQQWTVTNLAGNPNSVAGFQNGAPSVARFNYPYGLDLDAAGNVYVADALNHCIRMVTPQGAVSTFAGLIDSGVGVAGFLDAVLPTEAKFSTPQGIVLFAGNFYVADRGNNRIRKIADTGEVTTFAGSGAVGFADGNGTTATFNSPSSIAADPVGVLYVADEKNHAVRKITTAADVTTQAGLGTAGFQDGDSTVAKFNAPAGLLVARSGALLIADTKNHLVRSVAIAPLRVATVPNPLNVDTFGEQVSAVLNLAELGLSSNVTYYFRYRLADNVTFQPSGQSFIQVDLPTVTTQVATNLTPTAALMNGAVNPKNLPTTALLEYTTDPDFLAPYVVTTLAGSGVAGFLDSATSTVAKFQTPVGLAVSGGNVYVADWANNRIRKIDGAGSVTTFVGSGVPGLVDGTGTAALLDHPSGIVAEPDVVLTNCSTTYQSTTVTCASTAGLAVGASVSGPNIAFGATVATISTANTTTFTLSLAATGTSSLLTLTAGGANFYVADEYNHCIRKISAAGVVSPLAGSRSSVAGFADGAGIDARFLFPTGIALDAALPPSLYVADRGNHRIRKVAMDGTVNTFAGVGASGFANGAADAAQFASPRAVAVTAAGVVLVADTGNHLIRSISANTVSTLAGSGAAGFLDGLSTAAMFNSPTGLTVAAGGAILVTDSANQRIRRIAADLQVTSFAGSGAAGAVNSPTFGLYPISASQFNLPAGIAADASGNLFVTQEGLVRKIGRRSMPTVPWPTVLSNAASNPIFGDLSGLLPGTTYYFRAKGTCLQATVTGSILNFTPPLVPITVFAGADTSAPEVLSGQASAIDFGTTPRLTPVTLKFTISNPTGKSFTVTAINVPAGYQRTGGTGLVTAAGATTFDVTLLATVGGTFSGNVVINSDAPGLTTFIFPITGVVLDRPAVVTLPASAINVGGLATLNATVNPKGSPTTAWFQWSLDGNFEAVLVSTIAGSTSGYVTPEGVGTAAKFNQPYGLATDAAGVIYVADTLNHRIRQIATDGTVSTFAGTGVAGFANGSATTAQFNQPTAVVIGAGGTLFVADSQNHRIRAITSAGDVRTYSGFGVPGFTDGVATAARFTNPRGLALDAAGILYVADRDNHRIRKVATDGSVTTLAGTGTAGFVDGPAATAQFNLPVGIVVDAAGFTYVTEAAGHAIRKLTPAGTTSTFAGSATTSGFVNADDTAARFSSPTGIALDKRGTLFVADKGNQRLRKVTSNADALGAITATVTTVAGFGTAGTVNGRETVALFDSPISVNTSGDDVIVGELTQSTIRRAAPVPTLLPVATGLTGTNTLPLALPVTGLTVGSTYYFRIVATNARGTSYGNSLSLVSGTPFELWQLAKFGATNASDPAIGGDAATPANDRISNRIKYALGLNPFTSGVTSLPVVVPNGGALTLTYNRILAATDIVYTVEWSADLKTWNTAGLTQQVFPDNGTSQQIIASIPIAPDRLKFLRLTVTFQSF